MTYGCNNCLIWSKGFLKCLQQVCLQCWRYFLFKQRAGTTSSASFVNVLMFGLFHSEAFGGWFQRKSDTSLIYVQKAVVISFLVLHIFCFTSTRFTSFLIICCFQVWSNHLWRQPYILFRAQCAFRQHWILVCRWKNCCAPLYHRYLNVRFLKRNIFTVDISRCIFMLTGRLAHLVLLPLSDVSALYPPATKTHVIFNWPCSKAKERHLASTLR